MLSTTSTVSTTNGVSTTETIKGFQNGTITFIIDELKSKEIKLMMDDSDVNGTTTTTSKMTYTLTAK